MYCTVTLQSLCMTASPRTKSELVSSVHLSAPSKRSASQWSTCSRICLLCNVNICVCVLCTFKNLKWGLWDRNVGKIFSPFLAGKKDPFTSILVCCNLLVNTVYWHSILFLHFRSVCICDRMNSLYLSSVPHGSTSHVNDSDSGINWIHYPVCPQGVNGGSCAAPEHPHHPQSSVHA